MMRAALAWLALCTAALAQTTGTPPPADPNIAATPAGRGWYADTGLVSVAANQQLDVTLTNPSGSGCTAVINFRQYTNTSTSDLSVTSYLNPTAITGAVSGAVVRSPGNRMIGTAANSGMSFGFLSRASGSMGGAAGLALAVFQKTDKTITIPTVVPPGATYGVSVAGLTGLLANAVTAGVAFSGYCS